MQVNKKSEKLILSLVSAVIFLSGCTTQAIAETSEVTKEIQQVESVISINDSPINIETYEWMEEHLYISFWDLTEILGYENGSRMYFENYYSNGSGYDFHIENDMGLIYLVNDAVYDVYRREMVFEKKKNERLCFTSASLRNVRHYTYRKKRRKV